MDRNLGLKSELVSKVVEWWDGGAAFMIALLFWIVVGLLVISVAAYESLDLFIKAFTAVATFGVGIAVWQTTRVFQKATISNAEKKLRLDLFDKRLPVWTAFKESRADIRSRGEVNTIDLAAIDDLRREAEMYFGEGEIAKAIREYAAQAFVAAGSPRMIGIGGGLYRLPTNQIVRDAAFSRMEDLGTKIAEMLKSAIQIGDLLSPS